MNKRIVPFINILLLMLATVGMSGAYAEPAVEAKKPMTQEEYDAYHEHIGDQVEAAARKAEVQRKKKPVTEGKKAHKGSASGYGQGYRARQAREGRSGAGGPGR